MKHFKFVIINLLLVSALLAGQNGVIKGKVVDSSTKQPLAGVNVMLVETTLGASTDVEGNFYILNVPVGDYQIKFMYIGYETHIKTDINIKPERDIYISVGVTESMLESETITISESYFQKDETAPISSVNLSYEEIRRAPGSAGDISRILSAIPGVSQQTDQFNDLMVRGGSPSENGYYIDNMPIPNINHFPVLGAAGGAIGILNTDFIQDVTFYTGGFSSAYGDRLSSIMDISYREGNKEKIEMQLDLNFSGFGGQIEGPVPGGKGSWLFSAKRSYLDIVQKAMGLTGETPRFGDIQAKISYDFNPEHKLTALYIFAPSSRESDREAFREQGVPWYTVKWKALQNTAGLNWRYLWDKNGYSNTSITFNRISRESEDRFNRSNKIKSTNINSENIFTLRNKNFYRINKTNKIDFGVEAKSMTVDYDYFYASDSNYAGQPSPELKIKKNFSTSQISAFANFIWQPFNRITTVFGLRGDYYEFNKALHFSPRLSLSYKINERLAFNASAGMFYRSVPLFLVSQSESNEKLKNLKSTHYIAGFDYMLSADTKLTLEAYAKEYRNFPLSPDFPSFLFWTRERTIKLIINMVCLNQVAKAIHVG